MNEEEKQAIEIIKSLEFYECDWYLETDILEGHEHEMVEIVRKAIKTISNLIEKQQKEIDKCEYYQDHADLFLKENKKLKKEIENRLEEIKGLYQIITIKDKELENLYVFSSDRENRIDGLINKIKEKIEELEKPIQEGQCLNVIQGYVREGNLILLKELLGETND